LDVVQDLSDFRGVWTRQGGAGRGAKQKQEQQQD